MEIKDYLRVLGKRAWLLVMIPAVAGVVAGLIAVGQPQAFRTTATLQLPRDETTTPAQVAQLVADFQAAADNPTVQNQVSAQTGVPVKRIQRVRITQVGDSSQLTMSFQDKRKDATDAKAVINGIAEGALGYLRAPELRNSERAVQAASARIDEAQSEIDKAVADRSALQSEVQSSSPEEDLSIARNDRSDWNQELIRAKLAGDSAAIVLYEDLVTQADQRIIQLGGAVQQAAAIDQRQAAAEDALAAAVAERDDALQLQSTEDSTPTPIFSAEGQSVVRKTRVVKTAAAAVVAGFPIAIGVVLLLDAAQKRRARRPVRPEHDDELAGTADDEHELEAAPTRPVSPSPALIGATPGPAGLPAGSAAADDLGEIHDTYHEYDDEVEEADELEELEDADEFDEVEQADELEEGDELGEVDELDEVEEADELEEVDGDAPVVLGAVGVPSTLDEDLDDDDLDEYDDELSADVEEAADPDEIDEAADPDEIDEAEVLHELDEEDLDDAELEDTDLDEADLDETDLDELALAELGDSGLDDDLDDADLGDDLDEELEDDVAATVATRRRLYDADIDEDLSVDGGPLEHHGPELNGPERNGQGRVWARVPAADADFDGDDEAGADR